MNVEAYNSFCTVGSDHRVVCARIKLSLRTAKNARKVRYDWKQFSNSHQIQEKYTVTVKKRFQEKKMMEIVLGMKSLLKPTV